MNSWLYPYYTTSNALTTTTNLVYGTNYKAWAVPPEQAVWPEEAAPIPESDLSWLKRRVSEISWVPA